MRVVHLYHTHTRSVCHTSSFFPYSHAVGFFFFLFSLRGDSEAHLSRFAQVMNYVDNFWKLQWEVHRLHDYPSFSHLNNLEGGIKPSQMPFCQIEYTSNGSNTR